MDSGPYETHVEDTTNKRFGLVVGGILIAIGAVRIYLHGGIGLVSGIFGAVGLFLVAGALTKPDVLSPLNRAWTQLGLMLHKVTNPIFLGAIYIAAIIPTGFVMRALGIDNLRLRSEKSNTYWISRTASGSTAKSLERPF